MNGPPQKPHILVVDDDESMRFMLQTKLFQCGYNVTLAASGTHAIQILQTTKKFNLVICDLKMPLKGGIDVIKYMKENEIPTPTVILTGFPERDKIISAAQMGIQDVLVKPVRHNDLMNMIRTKLGESDEAQESAA